MTQAIQINVPADANYEVQVTELHVLQQDGTLQAGTEARTELVPFKPGSNNTIHIWDTKSVIIREVKP